MQEHADAGVPKTITWTGPRVVCFTFGKQEIGKGGKMNKMNQKYYQWCQTCCNSTCDNPNRIRGCTKAKCWIGPRKWKQHCSSQTHMTAVQRLSCTFGVAHRPEGTYQAHLDAHQGAQQQAQVQKQLQQLQQQYMFLQQQQMQADMYQTESKRACFGSDQEKMRRTPPALALEARSTSPSSVMGARGVQAWGYVTRERTHGKEMEGMRERGGGEWHDKLQQLQYENETLRGRVRVGPCTKHIQTFTRSPFHTSKYAQIHTFKQARVRTNTYINQRTHTYISTHAHASAPDPFALSRSTRSVVRFAPMSQPAMLCRPGVPGAGRAQTSWACSTGLPREMRTRDGWDRGTPACSAKRCSNSKRYTLNPTPCSTHPSPGQAGMTFEGA